MWKVEKTVEGSIRHQNSCNFGFNYPPRFYNPALLSLGKEAGNTDLCMKTEATMAAIMLRSEHSSITTY